jgi:hypothetical protein
MIAVLSFYFFGRVCHGKWANASDLGSGVHGCGGADLNHQPLGYEFKGELQIQIRCGADDNPRDRMNTGDSQNADAYLIVSV